MFEVGEGSDLNQPSLNVKQTCTAVAQGCFPTKNNNKKKSLNKSKSNLPEITETGTLS